MVESIPLRVIAHETVGFTGFEDTHGDQEEHNVQSLLFLIRRNSLEEMTRMDRWERSRFGSILEAIFKLILM